MNVNEKREKILKFWAIYQRLSAACVLFEEDGERNVPMVPTYRNVRESADRVYQKISVLGSDLAKEDWPMDVDAFEAAKLGDFYV